MKKLWIVLLLLLSLACVFVACDEDNTPNEDSTPAHTHVWGEWSVTVTPTCTTEGSHRRVCSGCPASEIEVIPAAHTYDAENTCTRCLDYKDKGVVFVLENYICTVTDYTGNAPEVIIPSKYMGSTVTSISSSVFENCSGLTSITIPDSVKSIGERAFSGCSGLTSITIPDSVKRIGSSAFSGCSGLTSVIIGSGVESIGSSAFWGCSGIIQKENGVSYVDKWVIDCDTSVTSVTLRANTVGIGEYAFRYCSGLTSITIPNSVTSIGYCAFKGCSGLTSINYRGTEAQWNTISKGYDWNSDTGNYTITYNYTGE